MLPRRCAQFAGERRILTYKNIFISTRQYMNPLRFVKSHKGTGVVYTLRVFGLFAASIERKVL